MKDIKNQVAGLIAKQLNKQAGDVKPECELIKDLNADSLDIVEIVMTLEEHFELQIPDEEAEKMKTVQNFISYVEAKKA